MLFGLAIFTFDSRPGQNVEGISKVEFEGKFKSSWSEQLPSIYAMKSASSLEEYIPELK